MHTPATDYANQFYTTGVETKPFSLADLEAAVKAFEKIEKPPEKTIFVHPDSLDWLCRHFPGAKLGQYVVARITGIPVVVSKNVPARDLDGNPCAWLADSEEFTNGRDSIPRGLVEWTEGKNA